MDTKVNISDLRRACPLPVLMRRVGLSRFAKPSCPSPFRCDQNASWGIFQTNGRWLFKDFATGECGDEIGLLAHLYNQDQQRDFKKLLDLYAEVATRSVNEPEMRDGLTIDADELNVIQKKGRLR